MSEPTWLVRGLAEVVVERVDTIGVYSQSDKVCVFGREIVAATADDAQHDVLGDLIKGYGAVDGEWLHCEALPVEECYPMLRRLPGF